MEPKDPKPASDQKGTEKLKKERHRNRRSKRESGTHDKGKIDGKDDNGLVDGNGTVERLFQPGAEGFLSTWREYFSNHKALLLVMDFHTLRITRKHRGSDTLFKCLSCDQTLTSLEEVNAHIQRYRHLCRLRANWLQYTIAKIFPSEPILEKLDEYLEEVIISSALTEDILVSRRAAYDKIRAAITEVWPGATLHLVGSSYHGLGLMDCDLNISLSFEDNDTTPIATSIAKLSVHLESSEEYHCFERHFNEEKKPPFMSFKLNGQLPCNIFILDNHSHRLAKLLKVYGEIDDRCRKLCVLFRKWAFVCAIDGQSEGFWPSHTIYLMVIYFLQQLNEPVLPVLHELIPPTNASSQLYDTPAVAEFLRDNWTTKNTSNVATLWCQMLRFYSQEFDPVNNLVCITQRQPKRRSTAGAAWSGKRIAVMDPYVPDKNVARTVSNSTIYDFMMHCLRTTAAYFSIPQCAEGPIFGYVRPHPRNDTVLNTPGYEEFLDVQLRLSHYIMRLIPHTDSNYNIEDQDEVPTILNKIASMKGLYVNICSFNMKDFDDLKKQSEPEFLHYKDLFLFPEDARYLMDRIKPEKLQYEFRYFCFAAGEEHPRCCIICAKNGHTQVSCPELMLEKLSEMPIIDDELTKLIDKVCYDVYHDSKPSSTDLAKKEDTLNFLQQYVAALFPDATLTLFGSSKNGFGLKNSDMDICLTFLNCPTSAGLPGGALNALFRHMKKCRDLRKLIHIQSAKVPIIKFLHLPSSLEGDISLYNILAQENTKLLGTYAEIDERVKILGYMVKKFAKVCNVGDASKGSLSSYCYILMMIYFLQRCSPPVIPVLQALPVTTEPLPKKFVDGCNTYFYDDISTLSNVWPDYKKNVKSPGQLWIEFLRFYTEEFDSENYVVSIRSPELVLKLEKRWFTKVFAIEDPFDHAHNLGSGLTRKMNLYIIKAFRSARSLFTSKLKANGKQTVVAAYFNEKILAKLEPPNDRGCRICKCIGHRARMCPQRHAPTSQKLKTEIENKNPGKDNTPAKNNQKNPGKEQIAPNERFTEGNQVLFSSHSKPKAANPGTSQATWLTLYANNKPTPSLKGPSQSYHPLPANSLPGERNAPYGIPPNQSARQAQHESYQHVMETLLKSKATQNQKTHK
uniref:C2H2-type domain-containing protein n=1 Tax=Lygus hesperus TaxID=30085 RepID=A0A0K8T1L0_LYGHE